MANSIAKDTGQLIEFIAELKQAIVAYRAVPEPPISSDEETEARRRLNTALCRIQIVLISAPTSISTSSPTLH
jgi:hypothetical protein